MQKPKYPLDAALRVRETKVDRAARELAEKARARDLAAAERIAAERAREASDAASAALRAGEREALVRGDLRAADLMRGDAWEARVRAERETLTKKEDAARTSEAKAERDVETARSEVGVRRGEAKVIERDRDRWEATEKSVREKKDEEAANEAWRPRRS